MLILEYMAGGELYESVGQRTSFTEAQVKYLIYNAGNICVFWSIPSDTATR